MFYNTDYFEFVKPLEADWLKIREELDRLERNKFLPWYQKQIYNKDWDVFGFYNGFKQERGEKLEENCALCPETTKLLEAIPGMITATFSRLAPGTHIKPHKGYEGGVLRCHLGLIVPDRCAIGVNGKVKTWVEGKCMVFDDTYIHEAWNYGSSDRVVLLIDVKKDKKTLGIGIFDEKYIEPVEWKDIVRRQTQFMRYMLYRSRLLLHPIQLSKVLRKKFKKVMGSKWL